jgi:hypothetical protein
MNSDAEFDADIDAQTEELAKMHRAQRRRTIGMVVLAVLALIFAVVCLFLALDNAKLASSNAEFASQQQGEKKEIAKEAAQALCGEGGKEIYDRELCEKWADAAQEPAVTPSTPPVLPAGPTQAELVSAFREYCDEGNCRGRDGNPPTPDDIAKAFVAFCADGRCKGPAGVNGTNGKDGEPTPPPMEMVLAAVSQVCSTGLCNGPAGRDGIDGPPPSAEAVLAAVQQVCANDACRGPAGADSTVPGPMGIQGIPGRGIDDSYCQDNGLWQITYTDGEVDYDAGKCRETITPPIGGTP